MSRACDELRQAATDIDSEADRLECEAARRRWSMDLECAVIVARMDAAALRRELTR